MIDLKKLAADPEEYRRSLAKRGAESVDVDGVLKAQQIVTQDHIGSMDFATQTPLPLGQIDRVVSDGSGTPFEPRHTTHGFQYVRIEGHPAGSLPARRRLA